MSILGTPSVARTLEQEARPELDVPAGWLRLGMHAGEPDFYERLLALLLEQSEAVTGGLWLLSRTQRGTGLSAKASVGLPAGSTEWNAWLGERVRELFAKRQPIHIPAGPEPDAARGMLLPLVWEGAGLGVVLLGGAGIGLAAARRLAMLAGWAARLHLRKPGAPADHALLASAHSAEWPATLVAQLRRQSGARRAGLLREGKNGWRLIADSAAGEVKRSSSGARAIEDKFSSLLAGAESKGAIAFRLDGATDWGVLLEFEEGHTADAAHVRKGLASVLQIAVRVLPEYHAAGWRFTLARALLRRSRTLSPKGSRWVIAGALAVAVAAACLPVTETFEGDCELQPAQRFTVVAEVDGRIQGIPTEEGAVVKAGQTLATLDASTLRTHLEVAREQRQEQEAQARRAQGQQDMTAFRLAQIKAEQAAQEETRLTEDIRRSTITAPIDGKVLTKDLAMKLGTVLRAGDTLCEIGGLDAWNLQIAVPEDELDVLLRALERRGKLPVNYRLKAGSTLALEAEITSPRQVSEMAYPVDGRNVIYLTAPAVRLPAELSANLRPGFSGRAKIEGRTRPWGALLTRRLVQYLRLHWWL